MKIKATTPCYKFRDATPEEQIAKIKEELAEVEAAYTEFICPSCLMWSDDLRAVKAREIIKNFKNLRFLEDISISHEGTEAQ